MKIINKIILKVFKSQISKYQLKQAKNNTTIPIRLVIGSGYTFYRNWIITDIETLNLTRSDNWRQYFDENSITTVLSEHIFEHLNEKDLDLGLANIYKFLKPGGNLRIAVPDGYHPSVEYINSVKPGGTGDGSHDHKFLYNYKMLSEKLKQFGFNVSLLEYFDENGVFHFNKWNEERGKITRSALNDKRNIDGNLNYTSLIIDAIK
jgi:predicted SAM-dependent methyltransferase